MIILNAQALVHFCVRRELILWSVYMSKQSLANDLSEEQEINLVKVASFEGDFFNFIATMFPDLTPDSHSLILRICRKYHADKKESVEDYRSLYKSIIGEAAPTEILKVIKQVK